MVSNEWSGVEWNGMEWNGMDWNGMEWKGKEKGKGKQRKEKLIFQMFLSCNRSSQE